MFDLQKNCTVYYGGVVTLSEEAYNNLMENIYIMGNKANYDWLMESKAQLEKGKISIHDLIESSDDEECKL